MDKDKELKPFNFPLNGRLITKLDGSLLPDAHFQVLENLRYNDGGIEGIKGMTKINASALSKLKVQNGFHFKKTSPIEEDHVFVQVSDATTSAIYKSDGSSAGVPSTETFSLFKVLDSLNTVYFSEAPDQSMVFCDGYHNYIYSGEEYRSAAVINYDPAETFSNDITSQMNNNLTNDSNIYTLLPSTETVDAYTKLLIHANEADGTAGTSIADVSASGHTITAAGGAMVLREHPGKIGIGCGVFDGTGDYLTANDHADWNMADGTFTFEKWVRFAALPAVNQAMIIYSQRADASNSAILTLKNVGGVYSFDLILKTSGVVAYPIKDAVWTTPAINTWYHLALVRGWGGANIWAVAINGTSIQTTTSSATYPDISAALTIGSGTTGIVSTYPPAQSDTYVKATSKYDATYWPYFATDPAKSVTGGDQNNAWRAASGAATNQRFHIDLGTATIVNRFYFENYHGSGTYFTYGVKNFTLWGSNDASSFAELTYGTDTGWTQLTTSISQFAAHSNVDQSEPQYVGVTNATAYRYYAFKFADNYDGISSMAFRRVEFNPATAIAFNGYIDELRISKGVARYTENFTPSTTEFASDADTKLLLHMDGAHLSTTFTDSSGSAHAVTAAGNAKIVVKCEPKLGLGCLYCDGTGDYFTVPDHADWYPANGDFTIDTWIKINSLSADNGICGQYVDANNYWKLYLAATTGKMTFLVKATTDKASYSTTTWGAEVDTWYHIELNRYGSAVSFFVNGILQTLTETTAISTNEVPDLAAVLEIGACANHAILLNGFLDEFRMSKGIVRHTASFTPHNTEYGSASVCTVYIGSTKPLNGIKFYIQTANDTVSYCTVSYWNGTIWKAVSGMVDGTLDVATGTKTLAQDGLISFDSTVDLAKLKVINDNFAYYYSISFEGIDAATTLKMVTVSTPVQDIVDIWDGVPRQVYSAIKYTTVYSDLTINAYSLDYYATTTDTYADISALTSSQYVYLGFNERMTGLKVYLAETNVNTNAATIYVHYWNGSAWISVGAVSDGTFVGTKSFNRSGTVSWDAPDASMEFTTTIGNSSKWYYYRLSFSATLSANVFVDNISGIPVQQEIRAYRYPVLWQNRLFLLSEQSRNKNSAIGSSYGTNCVFNGTDSGSLIFGSMRDITCGKTLFTRYGGSLYENLIVCKNNETYLVDGVSFRGDDNGSGAFVVYQVSGTRGCIAPLTMQQCDTGYEVAPGITKHILAWLSNSGVVMFDSNSIIEISNDIGDRFFADRAYSMKRSLSDKSAGFYDATKGEYHILLPIGAAATDLNEEWVYDVIRKKWYLTKRGAKNLWCGFNVEDAYGNQYVYGGTADGFIERLDYGTTFDGIGIAYKFRFPDSLLNASWDTRKEIRQIRLVGVCKTATTQTVAVSNYIDGSTTAATPSIVPMANKKIGRRFYKFTRSVPFKGVTHSLEFSITTTDEIGGFDPLFVGGIYKVIDYDAEET